LRKGRLQRRSMSARPPALFGEIPRPPRDGSRSHVQRLLICVFTPWNGPLSRMLSRTPSMCLSARCVVREACRALLLGFRSLAALQ
jgi:hypothetical protein